MNRHQALQKIRCSIPLAKLWVALAFLAPFMVPQRAQTDELGALLEKLDLKQLQTAHVEKILSKTADIGARKRLQQSLADLYVNQLEHFIERPKDFDRVIARLNELENRVPGLKTPEASSQRLEMQFRHGEFLLSSYREDRRKITILVNINHTFSQLSEKFPALSETCEKKIESLEKIDAGPDSLANLKADQEIEKLSDISFRSSFFAGWSFFYVGISKQNSRLGKDSFVHALSSFCNFLDIDPGDDVSSWNADYLELGATRNCQAFLGVALSYLALGQNRDADACFELIRTQGSAPSIAQQIAFWQITSLMEFGDVDSALQLASGYLSDGNSLSTLQRGQIALAIIRFAFAKKKQSPTEKKLGFLGFKVLAQLRQFSLTRKLIEDYSVVLPRPSFYSDWITGQRLYQDAEKSGLETDYLEAAKSLQMAVNQPREIPTLDLENCRYQLGWAYYRGSRFQQAADCFELVIARIARHDPKTAATASWLQHDCYLKQSRGNPAHVERALAILENLVTRFPDSDLAKKASLQIVKLKQTSMNAEDTVANLKQVVNDSPGDVLSQYELCLANYRKYLELIKKGKTTAAVELEIQQSAGKLEKVASQLTSAQKLKLLLVQLDIQIRANNRNPKLIDDLASKAETISREVDNRPLLAELHYRQFQIAKHRKDKNGVKNHVQWLVENGDGTAYQKSVLVSRATQIENELKQNVTGVERKRIVKIAIDVYQKLAKASGYNRQAILTNKNSRVAVSRIAALMEEIGNLQGASENLELLVEAHPANVGYLQRYARVLVRQKNFPGALEYWRKLAQGLKKESDPWFEAKYNLMYCLAQSDPETAKAPLQQFMSLYEVPRKWKPRFDELSNKAGVK